MRSHFFLSYVLPCTMCRSLPEIDGLSKETVLTSWMAKFDCILKGTGKCYWYAISLNKYVIISTKIELN